MNGHKRFAFFLPNIFTALNLACGFASIILSGRGEFYYAAMILILGAIFDSVDGRVARLTGTESSFGEQFDSQSDVLSFGVAPALLMYNFSFLHLGRPGLIISFIYILCGALRLARFNANADRLNSDYFQGLPIPMAALAMVGYVLIALEFKEIRSYPVMAGVYVFIYSILMISNIPFYSFKNAEMVKKYKKRALGLIFLITSLIFMYEQIMLSVLITLYVLAGIIYYFTHLGAMKEIFLWKDEEE